MVEITFNYEIVMEIIERLKVLGVPAETLTKIQRWADEKRGENQ